MIEGSCICGGIRIAIPRQPDYANRCNCALCRRTGGVWGYFPARDVEVTGATARFMRTDIDDAALYQHFCPACGNATHWTPATDGLPDRMGINLRMFGPEASANIPLRFPDGAGGTWAMRRPETIIPPGGLEDL